MLHLTLAELYLQHGEHTRASEHAQEAWNLAQSTRGIGLADRQRAEELRARLLAGGQARAE